MEVALLDAVPKTLERARLIGVRAVNEDPRMLAFKGETEINIGAESVWNIYQAELIELIIDLWKGVLEHVFLTLKHS